ncbi:outer mitochondrial transmembrane helix translocase [Hyalella azteca]|uniref:Outer mitochondrial transmembrane helix translocase n=1 Tax=Hyalella azteca TaxID=294128 RepID=A0A8B7PJ45_HYAAZ|nr:outer mitochondrial transmembrane helix translocase [Hyalella azteca]
MEISRKEAFLFLARLSVAAAFSYYTIKLMSSLLDPTSKQKQQSSKKAQELLKKLGVSKDTKLNEYEHIIASQLVLGQSLDVGWQDVAGLQSLIRELRQTVILPVQMSSRHSSRLIKPPKGVLLHGPPGCGKTLLAKAVAREAGCRFINLDVSSLTDKWYGESPKLASAVFTLATKIQPCIIFIDEVDSFLRVRATGDHEATAMMKAQFLQQWDGLNTDHDAIVIVMAATNRPRDVDRAILRRLPAAFYVTLPGLEQREDILKLVMRSEAMAPCVDLHVVATKTESFSGSDLRELCRNASVYRLREFMSDPESDSEFYAANESLDVNATSDNAHVTELRPVTMHDFEMALKSMRKSRVLDVSAAELLKLDLD